ILDTKSLDTESQRNRTIDKLNELFRIEQAIIMEESNDDLFVNSSESLAANEISNTDQINYSLLGIHEDSDDDGDESNLSDEVARYLSLPKEAQKSSKPIYSLLVF
ncbi:12468_t:CDS:2, partial [Gigaspora rosea]